MYFKYDRLNSGANWQCVIRNAGTATSFDSGIAVATGQHRFKIIYDPTAADKVRFFIDDVECSGSPAVTTNAPGALRYWTPCISIGKTAGTTSRNCTIDFFYMALALAR
jgi:hypothetical protein